MMQMFFTRDFVSQLLYLREIEWGKLVDSFICGLCGLQSRIFTVEINAELIQKCIDY